MRLVIISDMSHHRRADGVIVGHGATVRELDVLATLFDEVRHVAYLHDEPAPASALAYTARNLELVAVPPSGGVDLSAKLDVLRRTPTYARTIIRELRDADAVHVRCPANISLYAVAWLALVRAPRRRWIKYAGAWQPQGPEPASYKLQRLWLQRPYHHAQVTINGHVANQPPHVHSFVNPCLTAAELASGRRAAAAKTLTAPIRLLFVGHLGAAKNPRLAIDALAELRAAGCDATLELAGEGGDLEPLRAEVAARRLATSVTLLGGLPRPALDRLYARAHFVLLPSRTEGWPKVLSEGMAAGAIPIATAVGSIPSTLEAAGAGRTIPSPPTASALAAAVRGYLDAPARWRAEVERAVVAAERFSYDAYREAVRSLLDLA